MADRHTPSGQERRQFARATLKTSVNLSSESNFYTGFAGDISEGGLFVATHNVMDQGTVVDIEFSLPDEGEPIRVQGEVRWIREYYPDSDGHPGMGFQFRSISEKDRQRILAFVKNRETLFYDD